jgi:p-hydroxybenzoate 3-monooxygenase
MEHRAIPHHGINLQRGADRHLIDIEELTGGRRVWVYGQQEVVRDLIDLRRAANLPLKFDAEAIKLIDVASDRPKVVFREGAEEHELTCRIIAGCDGFHGLARRSIPQNHLRLFEKIYPYAWLGILADAPPANEVVIYARHANGFALASMRSPTVSRLYLQCAVDENLRQWPDERIWDELQLRLAVEGEVIPRGRITQKGVTPMRSFVVEPMQFGRLFLAGDAAHIVPPTGAKGLNLAVGDVSLLARGIVAYFKTGNERSLQNYSCMALERIWKVQRFSWRTTKMMHVDPHANAFDRQMQATELDYLLTSRAAQQSFAANYTGLPLP